MIQINLESLKDVEVRDIGGNRVLLTLTNCTGETIEIVTTAERGEWIHDALEKVCVNEDYWYETMDKENMRLRHAIEEKKWDVAI